MSSEIEITDSEAEYRRFRMLFLKRKVLNTCIGCGSFFELPVEYVITNPTDVDRLFWIKTASEDNHSSEISEEHNLESLIIDTKDCPAGFARLIKPNSFQMSKKPSYYPKPSVSTSDAAGVKGPSWSKFWHTDYSTSFFQRLLTEFDQRWIGVRKVKIDRVYSVYCPVWPTEGAEWITRDRRNGWPPQDVIDEIVGFGCHLVPKPHQSNPDDVNQWRFSFSQAEVILIHTWTDVQKYVYHVLRLIKSEIVESCGGEEKTVLCTYFFKTVMLWACEEKPVEFWSEENLEISVGELLCIMVEWLIERCCPNYFIPANNMISHLPRDFDFSKEITSIMHCKEFQLATLLKVVPKAYSKHPVPITVPHKVIVYGLLSCNTSYLMKDSRWESLQTSSISSDNFVPELQYLFKAIQIHLRLMRQLQFGRNDVDLAENFFNLSAKLQKEGVSLEFVSLRRSVLELLQYHFAMFDRTQCKHKAPSLKSSITGLDGKFDRQNPASTRHWPNVFPNAGQYRPTLGKSWANASCWLGS